MLSPQWATHYSFGKNLTNRITTTITTTTAAIATALATADGTMKTILSTRYIEYPENVTVDVKARSVVVTGPRGTLKREFKHLNIDMQPIAGERKIRVDLWFGNRKQLACIRTVCAHVDVCILPPTTIRLGISLSLSPPPRSFHLLLPL